MNRFAGYQWTLAKGNEGQTSEANLLYPIIVPSGPFMTLVIAELHGNTFGTERRCWGETGISASRLGLETGSDRKQMF